jgi:ABC-type sugar transport system substrate-binding protein
MKASTFTRFAVAALSVTALAGCTTASEQDSDEQSSASSARSELSALEKTLASNLYVKAAEQSGKGEHTCTDTPLSAGETPRIDFSIEGLSHPFLVKQTVLAKEAAKRLGAEVKILSAGDDVNKQLTDVETAAAQNTDALLMMPANTQGLQAALAQYDERGVPYAFTQKGADGVQPCTQVLAPYALEGEAMGKFVVEQYADAKEPVKVAIISGISGDQSSVARVGTFKRELLKAGNFDIVAEQPGEYRREPSQKAMDDILAANPDVQLVFGANDEAALGALSAIQGAGAEGVKVVGLDGQKEMFTEIEKGTVLASFTHLPSAGHAVESLVKALKGEEVPAFQVFPGKLVTKEAIASGDVEPAF